MLKVIWCDGAQSVNDCKILDVVSHAVEQAYMDTNFKVGQEVLWNQVRLEVVKGNLKDNNVIFIYKEKEYTINRFGVIKDDPIVNIGLDQSVAIISGALAIKKGMK